MSFLHEKTSNVKNIQNKLTIVEFIRMERTAK